MKKTVFAGYQFALALLLVSLVSEVSIAQKTGSPSSKSAGNEVNVRIIERNGDEVRQIERTYRVDGLSDSERDKRVTKLIDSLKATRKNGGQRQMTIIIDDNNSDRTITRKRTDLGKKRTPADAYAQSDRLFKANPDFWNNHNWHQEFRWRTDSMTDQFKRFNFQIPKDFDRQIARPFEDWSRNFTSKPSTIRGLDAYPNNPDRDQLNIRFTAPAKGDVSIMIMNSKGKEVAKRELKDFSGEFVGQIDLGKKSQAGAYFITVTQNEDGAIKRVVID